MKLKLKILWDSSILKVFLVLILFALIILAIIIPSIINPRPKNSIIAFNRDANSGTREAFVNEVLDYNNRSYSFSPGFNVREVKNNDSMIRSVSSNKNTIGYVSFGTVAYFDNDGNPHLKQEYIDMNLNFAYFSEDDNKISPTLENIQNKIYPSRNFNAFFRVQKNSDEANILDYDYQYWLNLSENNNNYEFRVNEIYEMNNDTLKASYLFYSWLIYSTEAEEFIENLGEIPYSTDERIDFTPLMFEKYVDDVNMNLENEIIVEIVGSTSAYSITRELSNVFKNEINEYFSYDNFKFSFSMNGSKDAFSENVPGTISPYIGLQSREASDDELLSWGWNIDNQKNYFSFVIDAILVIYNTKDNISNDEILYVNSDSLNKLYSDDKYYEYNDILKKW